MKMRPVELGDQLARLVWESVTDFLDEPLREDQGSVAAVSFVAEEVLILFLWIHTRTCQQAFSERVSPEALREILDALHRAVYDDLEAHGITAETLPLFEQRLSARYQAYYAAANGEPLTVGEVAAVNITGFPDVPPALCAAVAGSALATAGPLRDFLEDVELRAPTSAAPS